MDILHTDRLRLRWFGLQDETFVLGLINEEPWKRHIRDEGIHDLARMPAWMEERLYRRYWRQGHGFWAVERKSDGEMLGLCGLIHRDGYEAPDLGYALARKHWGHGYAREAAQGCLRYAQEVLGLRHLMAFTSPDNPASGRLLTDLGFAGLGLKTMPGDDKPSELYEWRAPGPPPSDEARVDDLARRFFDAFDNRDGRIPTLTALPHWFTEDARIHRIEADGPVESMDVRAFLEPRLELFRNGTLKDFHEWETGHETKVEGALAQRWSRYRKEGVRDGEPFSGGGRKTLQLIRQQGRWRISALGWQDEASTLPQPGTTAAPAPARP